VSSIAPKDLNALPPMPTTVLGHYRHYKGGDYEVIGVARHSETEAPMVVYRPMYNNTGWWVRDHSMFFESLEVDGVLRKRFDFIGPTNPPPGLAPLEVGQVQTAEATSKSK